MDAQSKASLITKLKAAGLEVGGALKADKKNREQNYDYMSADKILTVCGQALFKSGVAVIPNVTDTTVTAVERTGKSPRYDVTVKFLFAVTDGENEYTAIWHGMGSDYSVPDRALYKAITSGHKYFLLKLLEIGEGNEDGDHESEDAPAAKPAAKNNNGGGMKETAQAMGAAVTAHDMTLEEAGAFQTSKGAYFRDLTIAQLALVIEKTTNAEHRAAAVLLYDAKLTAEPTE